MKKSGISVLLGCGIVCLLISLLGCKLEPDPQMYSVAFDTDGGSTVTSQSVLENEKATRPATNPTKTGYVFVNWYTDTTFATVWNFNTTITKDTTLYAKWTDTTYTVEHWWQNVNGSGYTKNDTENLGGTTGETATATSKTYAGFSENTTHGDRIASGMVADDGSLVLKLYYDRQIFTVSFNGNGGSSVSDITGVRYEATVTEPTEPTRSEYVFDGWYTEESYATQWDFNTDTVTMDLMLYAKWRERTVGDIGPTGGYIFYENPNYASDNWRYLEAAPYWWHGTDTEPSYIFGFHRTTDTGSNIRVGTEKGIGSGKANTLALVTAMGDEAYSDHTGSEKAMYAAKACLDYRGGGYNDWFLPSIDELNKMYDNLKKNDLGGFSKDDYWSSSEGESITGAFSRGPGYYGSFIRNLNYGVRPVRAF